MLYFDHNATTPVAPEVASCYSAALETVYGNASSVHRSGQLAKQQLEASRGQIAASLKAKTTEVVFTSGGTESNNLAILGLVREVGGARKHIITSKVEHPSVLQTCRLLEESGNDVSYVGVDADGRVLLSDIEAAVCPDTVLVSVMHANNEVGTLQPLREIAALVAKRRAEGQKIYLHSDGVQAFGKIPLDLQSTPVDLYTISAHKIYGPKGIGALFVRKGTPLKGIQAGGNHERQRRPGTENVPGIMAFAKAVECCQQEKRLAELRDDFERLLLEAIPDIRINGHLASRLPNTSNVIFPHLSGEAMVIALDMKGMAVSTGSACSSGSIEPSHVLLAMGRTLSEARSSVRFSFGRGNSSTDVQALVEAISAVARRVPSFPREGALVGS